MVAVANSIFLDSIPTKLGPAKPGYKFTFLYLQSLLLLTSVRTCSVYLILCRVNSIKKNLSKKMTNESQSRRKFPFQLRLYYCDAMLLRVWPLSRLNLILLLHSATKAQVQNPENINWSGNFIRRKARQGNNRITSYC